MEVLVRPLRAGVSAPYEHLMDFLTSFPNLRPMSVDLAVAQEAASLRAAFRLSTADALIVATGIAAQVHHLVTNDADWVRKLQPISGRIRVALLAHHL
jgi:predicted nucleic acid-binding protein